LKKTAYRKWSVLLAKLQLLKRLLLCAKQALDVQSMHVCRDNSGAFTAGLQ
jgi:hypothetical protein